MPSNAPRRPDATNEDARKTVVETYYRRGVEAPDRERARAEKGYTISSAVAGALVAAGVFGDLSSQTNLVKGLGLSALILWIVTALLYVRAVAAPTSQLPRPPRKGWDGAGEFLQAVSTHVANDVAEIRQRAAAAWLVTLLAVATTFAALAAGVADVPVERTSGTITLTAKGRTAIAPICGPTQTFSGEIDLATLDDEFIEIQPDPGVCSETDAALVQIPRESVAAVAITDS
jgi:hypothetical protein